MVIAELSTHETTALVTVGITALVVIGSILIATLISDAFEYWVRHKYPYDVDDNYVDPLDAQWKIVTEREGEDERTDRDSTVPAVEKED